MIPSGFVFVSIIAVLALFVLVYLRLTSDFLKGVLFTKLLLGTLFIFICVSFLTFLLNPPPEKRTRVSVFPPNTLDFEAEGNWTSWALAEYANMYLENVFSQDTLVYPVSWTWQAIDRDSVENVEYLYRYAESVGLDYFVISLFHLNDSGYQLSWQIVNVEKKVAEFSGDMELSQQDLRKDGFTLAANILETFGRSASVNKMPDKQPSFLFQECFFKAERFFAERQFDQAVEYAQKAFKIDSTDIQNRNLLAKSHLEQSVFLENEGKGGGLNRLIAYKICQRSIQELGVKNAETHRIIGKYYLLREIWGKAEEHLKKALELDKDNVCVYHDFARLHRSRIKKIGFSNEEAVLRYAVYLNPCYEEARLRLADHLYFNKFPKRAEREVTELLKIHPRSIEGLLFLGKMAVASNDIDKIVKTYNQILDIDPRNSDAYYNLGVYYFNSGDIVTSERFFNRAIQVGNHVNSYLYLGHIFYSKGDNQKAIESYRLRIRYKKGIDDPYADEARKRLFQLTKPDSTILKRYGAK